ncbi:hypothetical protein P691DRAFT_791912 [Macrolepiota fuliginosa MF-IS2]|uniref:Uncharacterized protein n=1 Tax=Macrolepiota fuliginosa MF-IS2 TaxID=1400762 RepID=A0A9P5XGM1_9AGAR|nr:hypothetical protein P691DRAFT_791912 [Macrolepiota fuliginosa MF-IS2]
MLNYSRVYSRHESEEDTGVNTGMILHGIGVYASIKRGALLPFNPVKGAYTEASLNLSSALTLRGTDGDSNRVSCRDASLSPWIRFFHPIHLSKQLGRILGAVNYDVRKRNQTMRNMQYSGPGSAFFSGQFLSQTEDAADSTKAAQDFGKDCDCLGRVGSLQEAGNGAGEVDAGWKRVDLDQLQIREANFLSSVDVSNMDPQEWDIISAKLIRKLKTIRTDRLKQTHRVVIERRLRMFQDTYKAYATCQNRAAFIPLWWELLSLKSCQSLIYETPSKREICIKVKVLGMAVEEWVDTRNNYLASVIGFPKDPRRLTLATTFFICSSCKLKDPISYPRILAHACLREKRRLDDTRTENKNCNNKICSSIPMSRPWRQVRHNITFGRIVAEIASNIVQRHSWEAGDEMEDRTPQILHQLEFHTKGTQWRMVEPDEVQTAREQEGKNAHKWRWPVVNCKRCSRRVQSSPESLQAHLEKWHVDVASQRYGYKEALQEFKQPLDTPMRRPPYAVRIPVT